MHPKSLSDFWGAYHLRKAFLFDLSYFRSIALWGVESIHWSEGVCTVEAGCTKNRHTFTAIDATAAAAATAAKTTGHVYAPATAVIAAKSKPIAEIEMLTPSHNLSCLRTKVFFPAPRQTERMPVIRLSKNKIPRKGMNDFMYIHHNKKRTVFQSICLKDGSF